MVHSLTADERQTLTARLLKIAESHQLTPGVHPGYAGPATKPSRGPRSGLKTSYS